MNIVISLSPITPQTTGSLAIIDGEIKDTPIFIRTSQSSDSRLAGSLVLSNIKLANVPVVVGVLNGPDVLLGTSPAATTAVLDLWVQGNVYHGSDPRGVFVQGELPPPKRPESLLTKEGKIVGRAHPQYEDMDIEDFISVRDFGAVGDGKADDTAALQEILDKVRVSPFIPGCWRDKLFFFFSSLALLRLS